MTGTGLKSKGDIEDVEGVFKIARIRVRYLLKVPTEQVHDARESFSSYIHLCPAAQSVIGCIGIEDELITEEITAK